MQPAICLLSVVPLRREPSHRSEMVSQLLFGEYVMMKEKKEDFVFVTCLYDGYEGWVQVNQLTPVSEEQILTAKDFIGVFAAEVQVEGRCRSMPLGTPVYAAESSDGSLRFGNRHVVYRVPAKAVWSVNNKLFTPDNLNNLVGTFLDTPYLWGGKSVYGIDCSGFVQQVFKLFGIKLLRDAYLQAEQGIPVPDIQEAKFADLAFFQNEKARVTHVGIILENNDIVHASGKVRVDKIDREGIKNGETGQLTHHFHSIRRVDS